MLTLVHLSDLHFGRVDTAIVQSLRTTVEEIRPEVVVVSGDLTQRARTQEFKEARAFLDLLPPTQIIVPGNHDIPLGNLFARFFQPLSKYNRYISNDLEPFYVNQEVAILGINTACSLTIQRGRINKEQILRILERLAPLGTQIVKILVSHHPFEIPEGYHKYRSVGRSRWAMEILAKCGVDIFLAGHLHVSHVGDIIVGYKTNRYSALIIQAGTATSTRSRGEPPSFNRVRIAHPQIMVERFCWHPEKEAFGAVSIQHFRRTSEGWLPSRN
ncbi:MAG TPA: metallophosphoesterase [Candidatus Limnocylindrales bacterium]|nr:metallophosphoesterase [Candidatus Limnocylindrales bacterium]